MTTTAIRLTAAERREAVLDAAMAEFAAHGYEGSSTEEIARRAGIARPYVFRFFATKRNLFKAAIKRCLSVLRLRVTCSRQVWIWVRVSVTRDVGGQALVPRRTGRR